MQDAVSGDAPGFAFGTAEEPHGSCVPADLYGKQPGKRALVQRDMGKPRYSFTGPALQPARLQNLNFRADGVFFCPRWLKRRVVAVHLRNTCPFYGLSCDLPGALERICCSWSLFQGFIDLL